MEKVPAEIQLLIDAQRGDSEDRVRKAARRERLGYVAAAIMVVLLGLSLVALNQVASIKETQGFLVTVDKETGGYQVITRLEETDLSGEEALVLSELYRYVTRREGYDRSNVWEDYDYIQLTSGNAVFREYAARFDKSAEDNIYDRFKQDRIKVQVHSVIPVTKDTHQIRYSLTRYPANGSKPAAPVHYAAYAKWEFSKEALSISDRWVQPFGFKVTNWRSDLENYEGNSK